MAWGAPRGIDDIVSRVRANDANLTSLYLMRQRRFELADANALCDALMRNNVLHDLNISSHEVSPEIAAAFASLLAASTVVKSLDLGNASFGDQSLAALCPGIAVSMSLLRLNLENKGLTATGCIYLAAALSTNSSLQELILTRNNIGEQGLAALGTALVNLQNLSLSECDLSGTDSGTTLSTLLSSSSQLQVLRLEENAIDYACINSMSPGLGSTVSLRELHLRGCPLQSTGISTLFQYLPKTLTHIDISGTDAGPEGLIAAAAWLIKHSNKTDSGILNLRCLVACGCKGDDASLAALITSLDEKSESLSVSQGSKVEVDFSGNHAGRLTIAAIARCSQLSAICLHDCKLGSDGGDALRFEILDNDNNTDKTGRFINLRELDISANELDTLHLVNILDALCSTAETCCPALNQLVIAANPGAMEQAVIEAIERLQEVRAGLDVVRRSADTGERDGQQN